MGSGFHEGSKCRTLASSEAGPSRCPADGNARLGTAGLVGKPSETWAAPLRHGLAAHGHCVGCPGPRSRPRRGHAHLTLRSVFSPGTSTSRRQAHPGGSGLSCPAPRGASSRACPGQPSLPCTVALHKQHASGSERRWGALGHPGPGLTPPSP